MKMLQINCNRSCQSMDLAWELAERTNVDLLLVTEPNRRRVSELGWFTDQRLDAAIRLRTSMDVLRQVKGDGLIMLELSQFQCLYKQCK